MSEARQRNRRTQGVPTDAHIAHILSRTTPIEAAAILLLADAGCRLGEALAFDPSSLTTNGLLRIWGAKVHKWRTVPLTRRLSAALSAPPLRGVEPLRPLPRRQLQRRLSALCAAAAVPLTSPHRFRHSYATRLAAAGVQLPIIQALLGHANIATTLVYIHLDGDHPLRSAAAALDRLATHTEDSNAERVEQT
jgi:integrase